MSSKIKALVFDLDRTLYDRWATLRGVVFLVKEWQPNWWHSDMCYEQLYEEFHDSDFHHIYGGWEEVYEDFLRKNIFNNAPDVDTFRDTVLDGFMHVAVPIPTVNDMLIRFHKEGYKTGLITNGDSKLQWKKVHLLGLENYVDEILVSGDLNCAKPDAEIFWMMADKLGVDIKEIVFVGDGPLIDVQGSYNAGCTPVFVKTSGEWRYPQYKEPELQINDITEFPALLKTLVKE